MTLEEFIAIELNRWEITSKIYSGTDNLSPKEGLNFSPMAVDPYSYLTRTISKFVRSNFKEAK